MPDYTQHYGLLQPQAEEFYNVEDQNGNMDIIDQTLHEKANTDLSNIENEVFKSKADTCGAGLQLGETSTTAYQGDKGKIAYEHSQQVGNPHATTKADVGLADVDNTTDADKPISTSTQTALDTKANMDLSNVDDEIFKTKADACGVGSNIKLIENLTTAVAGSALDATQGKILNDTKADKDLSNIQNTVFKTKADAAGVGNSIQLVNNLTTSASGKALDAMQGKVLNDTKANKENPVFTGALSSGRKSGTTVAASSIAYGVSVTASEQYSCAIGYGSVASGYNSYAEGTSTTASGSQSHAEGRGTVASGITSHAEGESTTASGHFSHAEGSHTQAIGDCSHATGSSTIANANQTVVGKSNVSKTGGNNTYDSLFIVGNGDSVGTSSRSNAFRVQVDGQIYSTGAYNTSGADYAEMFEWIDGNPDKEDRRGLFVTLNGEKIRIASADDYILGIVSANPAVIGDQYADQWNGMYLCDIFGAPIVETVEIPEEKENDIVKTPVHTETRWALNPEYDPNIKYIPRDMRPEWAAIGWVGKLVTIDDGTCEVNGYAKVADGGIATKADGATGYRVLARKDETHVLLLLK